MPILKELAEKNKKITKFQTTPKMSTYLLYLGVGKFEYLENNSSRVKIRVYTVPGKKNLGKMALDYAQRFLGYFDNYFGIKYPLPKCDFIAIPDFSSGAMENWGAITFREIVLLGDEKTSVANKEYIAEVIAHELAHQWFGNLVTMKWWDDLWLNESFATFMAQKAVSEVFPEWEYDLRFYEDILESALSADALKSTHPISVPIKHVKDVPQIFDRISYEKGCSILHMLESYIGPDNFRNGLATYLKRNEYSNAAKEDLWNALAESSKNKNVTKMMGAWVNKAGYPIITVNKTNNAHKLSQKRFLLSGEKNDGAWPIPIQFITDKGKGKDFLLDKQTGTILEQSEWIKLNTNQTCFYRVPYNSDVLGKLGQLTKDKELSAIDSWGIENDLFVLVRTGRVKVGEYLQFIEKYCTNAEYPLNSSIAGHLSWLSLMSKGEKVEEAIQRTSLKYHEKLFSKLGWQK